MLELIQLIEFHCQGKFAFYSQSRPIKRKYKQYLSDVEGGNGGRYLDVWILFTSFRRVFVKKK